MAKTTTIPISYETKGALEVDKAGRSWNAYLREMHRVYFLLGRVERAKLLEGLSIQEQTKEHR